MSLLLIYLEFCKVGLFAVGGGLATLPFLFHMAAGHFSFVRSSGWLSAEQVGNFLAIAQCSPGPVGVNIAVQAGFLYGGVAAGVAAAVGLISPAIIVITAVSKALQALGENKTAASVFSGLRPAAAGLLAAAGWGVWRLALYNPGGMAAGASWRGIIRWREGLVCAALFLLIVKFKKHPVVYVALGAAAGLLLGL